MQVSGGQDLVAVLQILRGQVDVLAYPILKACTIMGRHPDCDLVLDNAAISRQHAQVLESHGSYFVEDMRSRNGTYLNEKLIEGRQELADGDQLRICDVTMRFDLNASAANIAIASAIAPNGIDGQTGIEFDAIDESRIFILPDSFPEPEFSESSSTLRRRAQLPKPNDNRAIAQPEVKLRGILEITRALGGQLKVDAVLPKLVSTLFNIFPLADQGFVLLKDTDSDKLKVKATQARSGSESEAVAVSMTVVRYVMKSGDSILSANIGDDTRFKQGTSLTRMGVRSMMCVPLLDEEDEPLGVIQIVSRNETMAFDEDDLDLLESLAMQASLTIQNARLHEEALQRRELERDLAFATQVQLGFLPKSRPKIPGYLFGDYYEAALSVGGDYFDYVPLPDGRLAITIGDVAGKGMPAALLMARLYSSTRLQLLTSDSPAQAISRLNSEIASSGLGHRFITFLCMVLNPKTHELRVVNAGHLTPILRSADGTVRTFGKEHASLPLGIVPDMTYEEMSLTITAGDTIIAFTDGATEAMSLDKSIFGRTRLENLMSDATGPLDEILQKITLEVTAFATDPATRDDLCLIGIRRSE
ncbi:MAG: FHA domain-containing protein [Planctomycetota bacterium]|nr:MAG: FHA domain-containing protein [Planctomycetota bacterium]